MTWPANSLDLNPTENLWWKCKKLAHDEARSCNADLLTAIQEHWNQLDGECCFFISEVHASKNSGRHKSPRKSNKVLIVTFFLNIE